MEFLTKSSEIIRSSPTGLAKFFWESLLLLLHRLEAFHVVRASLQLFGNLCFLFGIVRIRLGEWILSALISLSFINYKNPTYTTSNRSRWKLIHQMEKSYEKLMNVFFLLLSMNTRLISLAGKGTHHYLPWFSNGSPNCGLMTPFRLISLSW